MASRRTGRRFGQRPADSATQLQQRLQAAIPQPICELDHSSPWQLLIATILSAQSTDARVNLVTPELFARWPTPAALGAASQPEVEAVIRSTGFFRNKARHIREASRRVAEEYGGQVPRDMEQLCSLPGVQRKTANVVLGTAFGLASGFVVDTHVGRVSLRLGLTEQRQPPKVEEELREVFPRSQWIDMGHRLVLHGRYVCLARQPRCSLCPLHELCPSAEGEPEGSWRDRSDWEWRRVVSRGEDG